MDKLKGIGMEVTCSANNNECRSKILTCYFSITGRIQCAAACAVQGLGTCDAYFYEQSECHTGLAKDLIGIDESDPDAKSVFINSLLSPGSTVIFEVKANEHMKLMCFSCEEL